MRIEDNNFSVIKDQSVAPYNFVSLPSEARVIADKKEDLQSHGEINKEKYSGYIEYSIKNKTPLIIGKGKKENEPIEFFKNPKGKYAIPGSTIRGLLRTNVAILSDSNISDDIEDGRFYYRKVASIKKDTLKDEYKEILGGKYDNKTKTVVLKNIRTGYIYKESEDKYILIPLKKINDKSYLTIKDKKLKEISDENLNVNYYESCKKDFKPSIIKISYKKNKSEIKKIYSYNSEFNNKGYILSSGYVENKKTHYILLDDRCNDKKIEFIRGSEKYKSIELYNNDLIMTKKAEIEDGKIKTIKDHEELEYYFLPDKVGEENGKPIFFVKSEDSYYFGFTPYIRIPYDNNIKQGINENYKKKEGYSYVDKLFGFSKDNNSYKGLLSFEDCICVTSDKAKFNKYNVILGEPHATSYNLYLKQDDDNSVSNYNNEFTIRGIKQYWIKDYITVNDIDNNDNVCSRLNAMDENNEFKGKIHFENLSKEELGLVLWALKVDEKAHENVGMGKPFGFGHIVIDDIKVKTEDYEKKFLTMDMNCFIEKDREEFIEAYKIGDKAKSRRIEEFRKIKTNIIKKEQKNMFRYMKISTGDKKVKNEFTVLKPFPDIKKQIDIIKKAEKKQKQTKKNDFDDSPFAALKGKIK